MNAATTPGGDAVTCGATAEFCECVKPAGHVIAGDAVHACDPLKCGGQWAGDFGGIDWLPVQMPGMTPS